jgi:ATP-dependent helicase/nuclease subunit A
MPLPSQLDIYKASAGSGKTFLLTIQYLQLLFQQPKNYRHILAVTFTNKATAEMKERILGELEKIARGQEFIAGKQNIYAAKLLEKMPGKSFDQLHEQAKKIYSAILHDYSRFAVSTIDSFVQRIIRSFAYEIGLDAGFKLQLNTDIVKEDLADRLFILLDEDEKLRDWVSDMAMSRLEEGKAWNFRGDMVQLSGELFKEKFQDFESSLKQIPDAHKAFSAMQQKLHATTSQFEKKWKELCAQGLSVLNSNGIAIEDFPYKGSSFAAIWRKPLPDVLKAGISSRVNDVLNDTSKMYSKTMDAATRSKIANAENQIFNSLQGLVKFLETEVTRYKTANAISRNLRTLRLMQVFSEQLSHYRSDNNVLLISDTHLLLRQLTQDTEASFIYEKIGTHYHHFLIDEFQDTSGFQWDNFKPLLENTLAEGRYNLLVGDVKQAIYRWRNGDWRLLLEDVERDLSPFNVKNHSLQDNRRSAKSIIEFNNYLFDVAPRLLQNELTNALDNAPENVRQKLITNSYNNIIVKAYESSFQHIPETASDQGKVAIKFVELTLENGEKAEYDELVLPQLHERICELLQQGYLAADIAVLTRKNDEARKVIEYLMAAQQQPDSMQYNLLSADALLLENNDAVSIIISALQWLASGQKLALVQLRQRVSRYRKTYTSDYNIFVKNQDDADPVLPATFKSSVNILRQLALPEMINALIRIFELQENDENTAYLLAFQDVVGEWSRYGEEGLLQFLQYWEEERSRKSLPAAINTNAVEVLTIHKSKGLAFTVLLIPYLNWKIKPDATKAIQLWVETDQTEFNDVAVVPVRYSNDLQQTAFAYDYFEEYLLGVMDSLNMLYVATTRARSCIIGWAPKPEKTEELSTIDRLLYKMAKEKHAGSSITIMPVQDAYDEATLEWVYGKNESTISPKPIPSQPSMPALLQSNWQQRLAILYKPLQTEQQQALQLPRQQGVLLHEALAMLQHPKELDTVINQMILRGLVTESQQVNLRQTLRKIVDQPLLNGWKNNSLNRLGEREIITPTKQIRRPDLILYNNNETLVIDFKFTEDKSELTSHQFQVREYVTLLQQLGFANVQGHLLYALLDETLSVN